MLQYHRQQQSIQTSAHGDAQQTAMEADNDVPMHDDAMRIDSDNVNAFSESEACLSSFS